MAEMQRKIDEERRVLESKKDMEEEEKDKVQQELLRRENELKQAQWVHSYLRMVLIFLDWHLIVSSILFRISSWQWH